MATLSSILAWRIPWTEEPGRYSSWDHEESDSAEQLSLSLSCMHAVIFSPSRFLCIWLFKESFF